MSKHILLSGDEKKKINKLINKSCQRRQRAQLFDSFEINAIYRLKEQQRGIT
jgi:hypothetical protein